MPYINLSKNTFFAIKYVKPAKILLYSYACFSFLHNSSANCNMAAQAIDELEILSEQNNRLFL